MKRPHEWLAPDPDRPFQSITGREWLLVLLITLAAFALRAWRLNAVGIDHFDEGVYAFSGLGLMGSDQPSRLYPDQALFSPPLYIALIGLGNFLNGAPSDVVPFIINVIFGTLTVPLLWWFTRPSFGPEAGVGAAVLLAANEFHISLVRTALTDTSFAFLFVLALGLIAVAVEKRRFTTALIAGAAVGLAWNTKYHGWFAGMIAAVAVVPWTLLRDPKRLYWLRPVGIVFFVGVTAILCYLPWAWYIQEQIGYDALARYQLTNLRPGYLNNLWQQFGNQSFLEGPFTRASIPLAFAAALFVTERRDWTRRLGFSLAIACILSIVLGGAATIAIGAAWGFGILLGKLRDFRAWLVIGWATVFVLSTPLYTPFARLVLPTTLVSMVLCAIALDGVLNGNFGKGRQFSPSPLVAASIGALVVFLVGLFLPDFSSPWRPSRSVANAATTMTSLIPEGARTVVLAEPAAAYYLHTANRPAFERIEDPALIADLTEPVYVVAGRYARVSPPLRNGLADLESRLTLLARLPMHPKDQRLLDDKNPTGARAYLQTPDESYELILYRLNPSSP